jgi:hypothetical protein
VSRARECSCKARSLVTGKKCKKLRFLIVSAETLTPFDPARRSWYEDRSSPVLAGKGYSSDVAGDGPRGKRGNKKLNQIRNLEERILSVVRKQRTGKKGKPKSRKNASAMKMAGHPLHQQPEDVQRYAIALSNPFSSQARRVGSIIEAKKSQKHTSRMVFTVSPEAGKDVILFFAPSPCNDLPSIYQANVVSPSSVDTYTGSTAVSATYNRLAFSSLPYSSTSVGFAGAAATTDKAVGRIISLGVKLENISPLLNRGGEATWVETEDHTSINSGNSTFQDIISGINDFENTRRVDLGRNQAHEFNVTPHMNAETSFKSGSVNPEVTPNSYWYPFSPSVAKFGPAGNATNDGAPVAALYLTSSAAQVIRVTAIMHVEYIGKPTVPLATSVGEHTDVGRTIIQSVIEAKQDAHAAPHDPPHKAAFKNVMTQLLAKTKQKAGDLFKREASNAITSAGSALTATLMS